MHSSNAKRGYYLSKAAGSVHFKLLKAAGRRCPSMEEVWPMLKEFMDSWALYFQKEEGTAVACFDTFDQTAQPRVRKRLRNLRLSFTANGFRACIAFPKLPLGRKYHNNRTCQEISGMLIVGTTSLKLPVSGYFTLVLLACDSHPNE